MCYYVYEKFSSAAGGRSAGLGVILRLDVDGRGHRGGRIVKGCGLAVGTGDTVALRVGCLDDELQVGLKRTFCFFNGTVVIICINSKLRMQGRWKGAIIMLKLQKIQCHSKNNCFFAA